MEGKKQFIAIYELKSVFSGYLSNPEHLAFVGFSDTPVHCLPVSLGYKPSALSRKETHSRLGCRALRVSAPKYFSRDLNGFQRPPHPPPSSICPWPPWWDTLRKVSPALAGRGVIPVLTKPDLSLPWQILYPQEKAVKKR